MTTESTNVAITPNRTTEKAAIQAALQADKTKYAFANVFNRNATRCDAGKAIVGLVTGFQVSAERGTKGTDDYQPGRVYATMQNETGKKESYRFSLDIDLFDVLQVGNRVAIQKMKIDKKDLPNATRDVHYMEFHSLISDDASLESAKNAIEAA